MYPDTRDLHVSVWGGGDWGEMVGRRGKEGREAAGVGVCPGAGEAGKHRHRQKCRSGLIMCLKAILTFPSKGQDVTLHSE